MAPHGTDDREQDPPPTAEPPSTSEVTRRAFLKTVGVAGAAGGVVAPGVGLTAQTPAAPAQPPQGANAPPVERPYMRIRQEVAENLVKRGIVGYADHLRVQPGETIRFMVSSEVPRYRADIVRLIHGDANPAGPGIKEVGRRHARQRRVRRAAAGAAARLVRDRARSSGAAADRQLQLHRLDRADQPARRDARLVCRQSRACSPSGRVPAAATASSSTRRAGWPSGSPTPSGKTEKLASRQPLRPWVPAIPGMNNRPQGVTTAWYFVAVTFDAGSGKVEIHQDPLNTFTFDPTRVVTERSATIRTLATNDSPLLIAGAWERPDRVHAHFNGKIDNPRLYREVLSRQAIADIKQGQPGPPPLAAWDFAADIESERITDTGPVRLHGRTVNLPMRAVTGHNWDSFEMDYKQARPQYGAIYFHDDDIDDARWEVGFEFRVPDTLKSGMYAARLRGGSFEDYIPFTVRPKKGQPTSARIALLIPTFSYLAYAGTGTSAFRPLSLYSRHSDGSGVCYSSRLRPITNMRPKIQTNNPWQFMADTHLIDWLDVKQFDVDFLTDEDLHFEGAAALTPYKVVVTATHPEYYSLEMLNGLRSYLNGGGRLMYLGGNGFYWVTPMDPTGRYIEVRRRDGTEHWQGAPGEHYHSLTGEPGGLWRFRGMAPQQFFGVGFTAQGFDRNQPYRRMPGSFDPRAVVDLRGHRPRRADRRAPVAGARGRRRRLGARSRRLRAGHAAAHAGAGVVVRPFGRLPARRRADQHLERRPARRDAEPAGPRRHGLPRVSERRRRVLVERHRVVRQPLVQQLHEQRVADHRERAAALRVERAVPGAAGPRRRRASGHERA